MSCPGIRILTSRLLAFSQSVLGGEVKSIEQELVSLTGSTTQMFNEMFLFLFLTTTSKQQQQRLPMARIMMTTGKKRQEKSEFMEERHGHFLRRHQTQIRTTAISDHYFRPFLTIIFTAVILTSYWSCGEATSSPKSAWIPPSIFSSDLLTSTNCTWHFCRENDNTTICKCDSNCWKRRDCCVDFWEIKQNISTSEEATGPSDNRSFALLDAIPNLDQDKRTCEKILIDWTPVKKRNEDFLMSTSCPNTSSNPMDNDDLEEGSLRNTRSRCKASSNSKDFLQRVPVYSPVTKTTYRNIYCATCNKDMYNIEYWNATIWCNPQSSAQNISEATTSRGCGLELAPPTGKPSDDTYRAPICKHRPNAISKCNATWKIPGDQVSTRRVRNLCIAVDADVDIGGKSYRNIYCALCNGITKFPEVTCLKTIVYCPKPPCLPDTSKHQLKSFTILFDVDYSSQGGIAGVTSLCPQGELYDPFRQQCRAIYCTPPLRFQMDRCVKSNEDTDSLKDLPVIILNSHLNCPKIIMSVNRSDIYVDVNKTLAILKTSQRYEAGDYEYVNDTLVVCANLSQNFVSRLPGGLFEGLSMAGLSLSLVALALKMFLYFALPDIRTFPDKIVFCLSASLFVAQFLFVSGLTASTTYELCATIGVVLHYALLSSFCWMSALAYDVSCTFANVEAPFLKAQSNQCRFIKYSLFAWVTPSLIVFVASVFDWTPIELPPLSPLRPYYGQAMCYISSRPALLVYFVGPVAILLTAIIVLFSLTSWHICLSSRQTAVAQRAANSSNAVCHRSKGSISMVKAHHLNFCLYLKLAVVLGLTWVSGFVAAYSNLQALWYIYIILNTVQGVYILLAFTPFRKVKRCVQHHVQHKVFYRSHAPSSDTSHKPLQRSSTRSSQTTTISSASTQRTSFLSSIIKE